MTEMNMKKLTIIDSTNGTREFLCKDEVARDEIDEAKELVFGETFDLSETESEVNVSVRTVVGATATTNGIPGAVPKPMAGDQDKVLSGAGTWIAQTGPTNYIKSASVSEDQSTLTLTKQDDTTVSFNGGTQSDWTETDTTSPAYIKNIPEQMRGNTTKLVFDDDTLTTTTTDTEVTIGAKTYTGATSTESGIPGYVPAASPSDRAKVLSGAGTWVEQTGGSGGGSYVPGDNIDITGNVISVTGKVTMGIDDTSMSLTMSGDTAVLAVKANTFCRGTSLAEGIPAITKTVTCTVSTRPDEEDLEDGTFYVVLSET